MPGSAIYSSVRHLLRVLLLFLAGSFSSGLAMPAPAPTSVELNLASPFDIERPAQNLSSDTLDTVNPCGRFDEISWVPALAGNREAVTDFQEVFLKATAERRLAMLVIYGEDCPGWIRMVTPLLRNKDILAIIKEKFHVYAVNADDEEQIFLIDGRAFSAPQLADMLGVEKYPTFVLFDGKGRLVQLLEHPESQQELRSTLRYAVGSEDSFVAREQNGIYNASEGNLRALLEKSIQPSSPLILNFDDRVDERPLAVFIEKPDCHHCDHFREHILADTQTRSLLERFRVTRVELPSATVLTGPPERRLTVAQWSRELGITNIPTVVFFDKFGKRIRHTSDHTDLFQFQSLLDYVASGAYQSDSNFTHYLRHRTQRLREHGYDVDTHLF